jgi:hypothetical protein
MLMKERATHTSPIEKYFECTCRQETHSAADSRDINAGKRS